jgi:hypothetical protein
MERSRIAVLGLVLLAIANLSFAATRSSRSAVRPMTIDNNASCDISTMPAATLLLPYFEVELAKPVSDAANTIFTIVNTSSNPQIARVTIWTDYGFPATWFNVFMPPYDARPVSLWDVVAVGRIPVTSNAGATSTNPYHIVAESCALNGGMLPEASLAELQAMLTTGVRSATDAQCRVGGAHRMAIGYVTVDVVNSCAPLSPLDMAYYSQILLYDNVLTGDYERINANEVTGNYAGGNPLVHIKAVPEGGPAGSGSTTLPYTFYDRFTPTGGRKLDRRQPLPSAFAARFIEGGTGKFQTDYAVWREAATPVASACSPAAAAMPVASVVRFDESENPTVSGGLQASAANGVADLTLPSTAAPATASSLFPPLATLSVSGWMYLNLDNRAGASASSSVYSTSRPSQNWVIIHMRAEGRYGVDYDATTLTNGCTPAASTPAVLQAPRSVK